MNTPKLTLAALLLIAPAASLAAEARKVELYNPVGHFEEFEQIMQCDVPVRGTLRLILVDKPSAAQARRTGHLPFGTKIVMRDFLAQRDAGGKLLWNEHRLVPGQPTLVLIQQKERGLGRHADKSVRTKDWDFALYRPDGTPIPSRTEVACMPCHQRYAHTDYTFVVHNFFHDNVPHTRDGHTHDDKHHHSHKRPH
jgi:hypothetical protein